MTRPTPELKLCPWCGCKPRVLKGRKVRGASKTFTWPAEVKCVSPRCPVRPIVERDDPDDALAAWNRRAK